MTQAHSHLISLDDTLLSLRQPLRAHSLSMRQ